MSLRIPFTKIVHSPVKPELVLANGTDFLVINSSTGEAVKSYPKDTDRKQTYSELHRSVAFSNDGSLLATSGEDKIIRVFDTKDWSSKLTRNAHKRANAIRFDKAASQILVADKFGDVYSHPVAPSTSEEEKQMKPLVGHVSMVTDMILCNNEKYIVTSDRDEHIRVSRFPNGYTIESFCLGHTDVVTAVRQLPWSEEMLISAGGDSTIRLWEFLKGTEVQCLDIKEIIQKYTPAAADANSVEPMVSAVELNPASKVVAIAFAKTPAVLLLKWNDDEKKLAVDTVLETENPVLDICFDNESKMWATLAAAQEKDDLLAVFSPSEGSFKRLGADDAVVKQSNAIETGLVETMPDLYTIFGLRKFLDLDQPDDNDRPASKNKKRKVPIC
ncbi:WD40-repeat-containing domain protein [Radiomyces spectabilis]|uniref:WD40-repeat-containing domain protein n=1 Tax=Radiomyces spectabilis TaxID=64574 RepID=UPI00221EBAF9|nr:WD40-repeat-containing domain protein [Radiomyces spectabilis]KAI8367608.1 WD40-repeat-containing domain protein [Radiomyces spectabilis]